MSSVAGRQVIPGVLVRSGGTSFEWSLEDISEGFYREHVFFYFICFRTGQGSCRIDKLSWMVVHHRDYTHKLPPFNPGFVKDNDKFSRVQVTCENFVLPFLHTTSMPGLQRLSELAIHYNLLMFMDAACCFAGRCRWHASQFTALKSFSPSLTT